MPKAIRLYGRFLIEIINDKEGGEALLERLIKINNYHNIFQSKKFDECKY